MVEDKIILTYRLCSRQRFYPFSSDEQNDCPVQDISASQHMDKSEQKLHKTLAVHAPFKCHKPQIPAITDDRDDILH